MSGSFLTDGAATELDLAFSSSGIKSGWESVSLGRRVRRF
jgi:hypothetical protein